MSKYGSLGEIFSKVEWEGGGLTSLFEYGFTLDELPDGTPPYIRDMFKEAIELWYDLDPLLSELWGELEEAADKEYGSGNES